MREILLVSPRYPYANDIPRLKNLFRRQPFTLVKIKFEIALPHPREPFVGNHDAPTAFDPYPHRAWADFRHHAGQHLPLADNGVGIRRQGDLLDELPVREFITAQCQPAERPLITMALVRRLDPVTHRTFGHALQMHIQCRMDLQTALI